MYIIDTYTQVVIWRKWEGQFQVLGVSGVKEIAKSTLLKPFHNGLQFCIDQLGVPWTCWTFGTAWWCYVSFFVWFPPVQVLIIILILCTSENSSNHSGLFWVEHVGLKSHWMVSKVKACWVSLSELLSPQSWFQPDWQCDGYPIYIPTMWQTT